MTQPLIESATTLRQPDVRALVALTAEIQELDRQTADWRHRLIEGLASMLHARAVMLGVQSAPDANGRRPVCQPLFFGCTPEEERRLTEIASTPDVSPFYNRFRTLRGHSITRVRRDLVDDREWYDSPYYAEVRRVLGVDDAMYSAVELTPEGRSLWIAVARNEGDRPFDAHDAIMLDLVQQTLRPFARRQAGPSGRLAPLQLPERLRAVLAGLVEGKSEKEVAIELSLSPHTVHDHVKELHRRLGVRSRGELLAQVLAPGLGETPKPTSTPE